MAAEYLLTRVSLHWTLPSSLILALICEKLLSKVWRCYINGLQNMRHAACTAQLSLNVAQLINYAAMQFTGLTVL